MNENIERLKPSFLNADDVSQIMSISKSKAYKIIKDINEDLRKKGYIVIAGKVSERYFLERVAL